MKAITAEVIDVRNVNIPPAFQYVSTPKVTLLPKVMFARDGTTVSVSGVDPISPELSLSSLTYSRWPEATR
jgi:hypothetical protein